MYEHRLNQEIKRNKIKGVKKDVKVLTIYKKTIKYNIIIKGDKDLVWDNEPEYNKIIKYAIIRYDRVMSYVQGARYDRVMGYDKNAGYDKVATYDKNAGYDKEAADEKAE